MHPLYPNFPHAERIIFFEDDVVRVHYKNLELYLKKYINEQPHVYKDSSLEQFIKLIQGQEYFKVKEGNFNHRLKEPEYDLVKILLQASDGLCAYLPSYCLMLVQRGDVYKSMVTESSIYENEFTKYTGDKELKKDVIVPKQVVVEIIRKEGTITFLSLIKKGACNEALKYIAEKREDLDSREWGPSDFIRWLRAEDKDSWAGWVRDHFPAITKGDDLMEVTEYNREKVYILRITYNYTSSKPDYRFYILHDCTNSDNADGKKDDKNIQFVTFDNSYSRWTSGSDPIELMRRCLTDNKNIDIFEFPAHSERYIFEWIVNHYKEEKK